MRWLHGVLGGVRAILPIAAPLLASALLIQNDPAVTFRAVFLVVLCMAVVTAAKVTMAIARPASLEIRRTRALGAPGQPLVDTIGLFVFLTYLIGWLGFLPLDAGRLHLLPAPPLWATVLGLVFALLGCLIGQRALWDNSFASPAVQKHAGQTVVSTGVYGVVRHPLYSGNLLVFTGMALWVGSVAGLLGVMVIFTFTLARVLIEERHLRDSLPGYAAYARAVRSRLIPFVL